MIEDGCWGFYISSILTKMDVEENTDVMYNHPTTEDDFNLSIDGDSGPEQGNEVQDDDSNFPLVMEESDSSGGEDVDAETRLRIRPIGNTFKNSKEVLGEAYAIIEAMYDGPWIRWSEVPRDTKEIWFDEFKTKFFWKNKHSQSVRANWSIKCSSHLRTTFSYARAKKKKPHFVKRKYWPNMLEVFKSNEFKNISERNKLSRASEGHDGAAGYTGGSKNVHEHVAAFKKNSNTRMTQEDLMRIAYQKKRTGEWSGSKPQRIINYYKELCKTFKETHPEGMTEEDASKLWAKAAGVDKKGRMFGQGSLNNPIRDFRNPAAQGSSSSNISLTTTKMEEIKKSIETELRKSIEDDLRRSIVQEIRDSIEDDIRRSIWNELQNILEEKIRQQLIAVQQEERAMQIQRLVETMQPSQYLPPPTRNDTSLVALLNSASLPTTSPCLPLSNPTSSSNIQSSQPTSYL